MNQLSAQIIQKAVNVRKPNQATKIVNVNQKLGNRGIKYQQGTTTVLYDMIPIVGQTDFKFFSESKQRGFPFTNVEGNASGALGVGESFVLKRLFIAVITADGVDSTDILSIDGFNIIDPNFQSGELDVTIANKVVMKRFPVSSLLSANNQNAGFDGYTNYEFESDIVLPPLLGLRADFRIATGVAGAGDEHLAMFLEGHGAIISPDTTL